MKKRKFGNVKKEVYINLEIYIRSILVCFFLKLFMKRRQIGKIISVIFENIESIICVFCGRVYIWK